MSNVNVSLGLEGNNLKFDASAVPTVTTSTLLKNINGGNGIDNAPGEFLIHNASDSINFTVDVSAAQTVGDVICEKLSFNNQK